MVENSLTNPREKVYISVDIEADGPCPGLNSMLSIGAIAFDINGNEVDTFEVNMSALSDANTDPNTMLWWTTQESAWAHLSENIQSPLEGTKKFVEWIDSFPRKVCVCRPSGFDFTYIYYYFMRFYGRSPFGRECIDVKSYILGALREDYFKFYATKFPKKLIVKSTKKHFALEDARAQGKIFFNLKNHLGL